MRKPPPATRAILPMLLQPHDRFADANGIWEVIKRRGAPAVERWFTRRFRNPASRKRRATNLAGRHASDD